MCRITYLKSPKILLVLASKSKMASGYSKWPPFIYCVFKWDVNISILNDKKKENVELIMKSMPNDGDGHEEQKSQSYHLTSINHIWPMTFWKWWISKNRSFFGHFLEVGSKLLFYMGKNFKNGQLFMKSISNDEDGCLEQKSQSLHLLLINRFWPMTF